MLTHIWQTYKRTHTVYRTRISRRTRARPIMRRQKHEHVNFRSFRHSARLHTKRFSSERTMDLNQTTYRLSEYVKTPHITYPVALAISQILGTRNFCFNAWRVHWSILVLPYDRRNVDVSKDAHTPVPILCSPSNWTS